MKRVLPEDLIFLRSKGSWLKCLAVHCKETEQRTYGNLVIS